MLWLSVLCLVLMVISGILIVKVCLLHRAADEIGRQFCERLKTDTNTLIAISSRDEHMRRLAAEINRELRMLRSQRQRFLQGDLEMKETITNVSHDLRTPLTAVCGYLDLLKGEEKSQDAERYIQVITGRVEVLKQLTEELFRYTIINSTSGELSFEEVNLRSALEESISAYYGALTGCRITPDIFISENIFIRRLNRGALLRVFGNVIGNAIKYSDGDLKIELRDNGDIVFSNRAPELDEIQVLQLFNRFYTVETGERSTGLGLSIARLLVEQMKGDISAVYKDGRLFVCISFPEGKEQ